MQFYEVNSERNCREFWVSWRFFSGVKTVLRHYDKNKRKPDSKTLMTIVVQLFDTEGITKIKIMCE